MILIYLGIFILIFIYYTFFVSKYFNSLDGLDKVIFICLFLFNVWFMIALYYLFCTLYGILFITPEPHLFFSYTPIEGGLHYYIFPGIQYTLTYILFVILFILLHIFSFWLVVIYFVPYIIIVPIPIIPFILPIPLKTLLLIPFQKLTDRGILPLMRRVIFGLFSEDLTKHLIASYFDIYGFFFDNLKAMISDVILLNKPKNRKISKGIQDDLYRSPTIDDENEETSKEIIEKNSVDSEAIRKIKKEYMMCVIRKKGLTKYGENNNMSKEIKNFVNNSVCNFDLLKNYLKINY